MNKNIKLSKFNLIEVKFESKKSFNKKILELKFYAELITKLTLDKYVEHDSVHYIKNIYYQWKQEDLKMKLYIDDYSKNGLCIDITSNNLKEMINLSKRLEIILQNEATDIKIIKNLEI